MASRAIERRNSLLRAQGKLPQQSSMHSMQPAVAPQPQLYQHNAYTRNQQLQIQQQQMQEYQRRLSELQKSSPPLPPQTSPAQQISPINNSMAIGLNTADIKKELHEEIMKQHEKLNSEMQAEILKQNNEILKQNTEILKLTEQNRILSDAVFELKDLLIKLQSFTMEVNKILYEERVQFLSIMPQEEEEVRENKMDIEVSSVKEEENRPEEVVQEEVKIIEDEYGSDIAKKYNNAIRFAD